MLIGEYIHSVDDKNRVSLPSKFRKEIGKKVVITRGLDNCLFLYPLNQWEKISGKLAELGMAQADKRGLNRFLLAGASEVDVDSNGRILVPDYLKQFANLSTKVVFAGVYDRVELWNDTRWETYKKTIEKQADMFAEKLGDVNSL
jgi:MraZ protein